MFTWESERCDLCKQEFQNGDVVIDGRTNGGFWANMCETCHKMYGVGLGTGKGQKYLIGQAGKIEG